MWREGVTRCCSRSRPSHDQHAAASANLEAEHQTLVAVIEVDGAIGSKSSAEFSSAPPAPVFEAIEMDLAAALPASSAYHVSDAEAVLLDDACL